MLINNFKIKRLDRYNIVIEEYRETTNLKTKEKRYEWKDLGLYFPTVKRATEHLESYILSKGLELTDDFRSFKEYVENYKITFYEEKNEVNENDNEFED